MERLKALIRNIESLTFEQAQHASKNGMLCALIVAMVCWGISFVISFPNILFYVLLCMAFIVGYILSAQKPKEIAQITPEKDDSRKMATLIACLAVVAMYFMISIWPLDVLSDAADCLPWYNPKWFGAVIIILSWIALFYTNLQVEKWCDSDRAIRHYYSHRLYRRSWYIWYMLFVAVLALLAAYKQFVPYYENDYSLYHRTAYTYELYARYNGLPYTIETSSVYGHFGLFLVPFLKLLGGCNYLNNAIVIAVIEALSFFIFAWAVCNFTRNKQIRYIMPVIFCVMSFFKTEVFLYYQGTPHRTFLIAVVLFVISLEHKGYFSRRTQAIWKTVTTVFALLWSTDFGLLTALSFAVYDFLYYFDAHHLSWSNVFKSIGITCARLLTAVIAALGIVNIYNLIVGGPFIIKEMFYPLLNGFSDTISPDLLTQVSPPVMFHPFWLTILLLVICAWAFRLHLKNKETIGIIAMAVFTMAVFVYFMSRAFIYYITYYIPVIALLCALMAERVDKKKIKMLLIDAVVMALIIAMTCIPIPLARRIQIGRGSDTDLTNTCNFVRECIPEDVKAYGMEACEIYSILGRDNYAPYDFIHCYIVEETLEKIRSEIESMDEFVLITLDYYEYTKEDIAIIGDIYSFITHFEDTLAEFRVADQLICGPYRVLHYERSEPVDVP